MAKMFVTWHGQLKNASPINGPILGFEEVTLPGSTTNTAPANAEYALVWSDSNAYFSAGSAPNAATDPLKTARAAGFPVEIRPIVVGTTKIAGAVIA